MTRVFLPGVISRFEVVRGGGRMAIVNALLGEEGAVLELELRGMAPLDASEEQVTVHPDPFPARILLFAVEVLTAGGQYLTFTGRFLSSDVSKGRDLICYCYPVGGEASGTGAEIHVFAEGHNPPSLSGQ